VGKERARRETVALIRLHVLAEGQTEEGFVNEVLAPELGAHGVFADVHRITTGRRHGRLFRGGFLRYEHLARDLSLWMKQDQHEESWFTTMLDLYGLPLDFPGLANLPPNLDAHERVAGLEAELAADLVRRLGTLPASRRLLPYIQLHEFEALLFSDPTAFLEAFPGEQSLVDRLTTIRTQFSNPEDIDDGFATAPSKRILDIAPEYEKPVAGILIAQRIGLTVIRRECRHFDEWVARLLALAKETIHPSP
jgi:hypothetical protein